MLVVPPQTNVLPTLRLLSSLLRANAMTATPTEPSLTRVSLRRVRGSDRNFKSRHVSLQTVAWRVYLINILNNSTLDMMTCVWVPLHMKGVAAHLHHALPLAKCAHQWIKSVIQIMDPAPGRFHPLQQSRTFLSGAIPPLPTVSGNLTPSREPSPPLCYNRPTPFRLRCLWAINCCTSNSTLPLPM